jgi:hypothetical protein
VWKRNEEVGSGKEKKRKSKEEKKTSQHSTEVVDDRH